MKGKSRYCKTIKEIPLVPLTDVVGTRFFAGKNVLLSFIEQPPGARFPVHSPDCEQILVILEGSEDPICGDERVLLEGGDVCGQPAHVPHGGETPTGFKGIDIFVPPREDYLELMRKHGLLE